MEKFILTNDARTLVIERIPAPLTDEEKNSLLQYYSLKGEKATVEGFADDAGGYWKVTQL